MVWSSLVGFGPCQSPRNPVDAPQLRYAPSVGIVAYITDGKFHDYNIEVA